MDNVAIVSRPAGQEQADAELTWASSTDPHE